MSLNEIKKELESRVQLVAKDINAKLQFETRMFNSDSKGNILLSCSFMPIDPMLNSFREKRSQYVMQIDYICNVTANTDQDEANIKKIMDNFTIDSNFNSSAIIYRPSSVSQWINQDSKRVAVISIYFQIDEVI